VTTRPWRAVASYRLAPGLPPVVVGRCYRATRRGLDRFIAEHTAAGCTVTTWEVLPITGVAAAAQVADSPAG
jgi:hypothetical protein